MSHLRVGEMLVESGVITREQLNEALRHQASAGGRLGTNLVELGYLDEKTLAGVLARQLSIPSANASQLDRVTPSVLALISASAAERLKAVPIREDSGRLWVAMADPTDKSALIELEKLAGRPVRTMVAPELLIQYALEKHYHARRRPRVVEVRTAGSDLLHIPDASRRTEPAGIPLASEPADPDAGPIYHAIPMALDTLDSVTGYLDEASRLAPTPAIAPAQLTMKTLSTELASATTDETVLDLTVRFVGQSIPRVWVFLMRSGELTSWGGRGIDPQSLAGVHVPLAELPLLAQSLSTGEVLVGRLQPSALGRLASPLELYQESLGLILPVRIGKHAVGVILGLDAGLESMRNKPELAKLALKVDQALHINYLRRLLLQP
ncbi:MAG: hypothetical protein ACHQ17_05855 [Polyangia bacterium]